MIIRNAIIATMLIATWLCIALVVMLSGTIATAAVPAGTTLPKNISIIGKTNHLLIIRSDDPEYVQNLYATGALFVLPARQKTCLSLQKTRGPKARGFKIS
jgi:hypothetical protein